MAEVRYYDPGQPIECGRGDCNALFFRPQDASSALSTQALAKLHGWTQVDREGEMFLCVQHSGNPR